MKHLSVSGLNVSFDGLRALADATFEVEEGEFFCIVGPTNAGKSTLLKTIAGLVRPESGAIFLKGRDVTAAQPKDRNVSLLFQNIALFPNMTGFENIAFPLRTAGVAEDEITARVRELGAMLKVGHVLDRLPRTFSGGEQQRIAIGRSIARPADVLMLDEPLTNLDARIRIALRIEFKEIHRKLGQTVIYVTHDQVEAMSMSDRIAVLHEGRFQQIGTPDQIYNTPANRFVAEFIGQPPMNILKADLFQENDCLGIDVGGIRFAMPEIAQLGATATLPKRLAVGVRPEAVRVSSHQSSDTPHQAEIMWVEHLGSKSILDLRFNEDRLRVRVAPDDPISAASTAWFGFDPKPDHLMNPETGDFFR